MNVIFGKENLDQIDERYTALELESLLVQEGEEPVTNYAIVGPDSGLQSMLTLKQFIPVHEALMRNYKEQNWDFCLQAIDKLRGKIDPFMDTFYDVLKERIKVQIESPTENWTPVVDMSHINPPKNG